MQNSRPVRLRPRLTPFLRLPLAQLSLFAIESHRFSPFPDPPAVVSP